MTHLLVIGGASLDVLHFAGRTEQAAGGAGMYTAVAASCSGARVSMLAPRPAEIPEALQPAAQRITWLGPLVPASELPHFEIAHHGGGRATLVNASWGAEALLNPAHLPADLSIYSCIHIAALSSAQRQLEFLQACRAGGAARISVGTYARVATNETETVRALLAAADIFFMNENEASILLGGASAARVRAGQLLFITQGAGGALVVQGAHTTHIAAAPAQELDATGAGDTFCGATLAALCAGAHPQQAARSAMPLAAAMVTAVGPAVLFAHTAANAAAPTDLRVQVNAQQVQRTARLVAALPNLQPFNFTGPHFPPAGHGAALDFFFAATLQQFGFWSERAGRYARPLLAAQGGQQRKGSDFLWHAYWSALQAAPAFAAPAQQAALRSSRLQAIFHADDGTQPMPALRLHLQQARAYGSDLCELAATPAAMLAHANSQPLPLAALLQSLDHVGGYKEDPLRKKSALLALILIERPERWLQPAPAEPLPPIVDYHLQRMCLRMGLVEASEPALLAALGARKRLPAADEWAVRSAVYSAMQQLAQSSGRSMAAIDWFFFNARTRCPEMTAPDCAQCAMDAVCAHRTQLFQPVLRTTFY